MGFADQGITRRSISTIGELMTKVVALHGQFASPKILRRDMGDPSWVDIYLPTPYDDLSRELLIDSLDLEIDEPMVLVGYSIGGSVIANLSHYFYREIAGVVLYESPMFDSLSVAGDFPVLWIRNNYQSTLRREAEFLDTFTLWSLQHPVTKLIGTGRHMKFTWGWPPIGHAWDQTLNPFIETWIKTLPTGEWL
jgi:pimeloyl-ACP methyl ester carboxylesterase